MLITIRSKYWGQATQPPNYVNGEASKAGESVSIKVCDAAWGVSRDGLDSSKRATDHRTQTQYVMALT